MNWCNGVIEIKRISFWELNIKCEGRWQTYKKGDIYLLNILKLSTQHWIILIFQRDLGFFPLQNSIIQEKSVTSLRSLAPVGDRSQDGGTTKGRAAVRSLFTGDARETAITSHRSWPVTGDVEGQPEERVGSYNQNPWQAWFVWKYAMLYRSGFISYFNDNCLFAVLLTCIFTWVYE